MITLLPNVLTFVSCKVHSKSHINHLLEIQPSEDVFHPSRFQKAISCFLQTVLLCPRLKIHIFRILFPKAAGSSCLQNRIRTEHTLKGSSSVVTPCF